jgi:glycosyltransferase involved in cell wall biosynthesis
VTRVILVDLVSWIGHHRPYFLMYTKILLELGYAVDALCLQGEEVRAEFPEAIDRGTLRIVRPELSFRQRTLLRGLKLLTVVGHNQDLQTIGRWLMVKNASIGTPAEDRFVFVLDLQGHLGEIGSALQKFLLPSAWAGLSVCPPSLDRLLQGKRQSLPLASTSCKAFCLLNEAFAAALQQRMPALTVVHLPDISYTECPKTMPAIVEELLTRAHDRRIMLLASLTKKHGLLQFLRLSAAMRASPILFCAIGLVDLNDYTEDERVEIETFLQFPADNLFVLKDFYPEEEVLNAIFKTADAVYICYENFDYSSNKLTKAICLGTPVLVTDNTLLADRVRQYQLGYAVDSNHVSETACSLDSLLTEFSFEEGLYRQFVDYYSEQTIREKLANLISTNLSDIGRRPLDRQ